jgi:hypothetical protein
MAYALVNKGITRPPHGKRYIHRQVKLTPVGSAGSAVATAQVHTGPGRIVAVAVTFGTQPATADTLIKADTTDGVTLFTLATGAADVALTPVGTTAVDEGRAVTAATDAFSGGFPIRDGFFIDVAQADPEADGVIVDVWVRLCTFAQITLVAQSGADGTGAVTRSVDLHGAGSLAAVALDFQNMPATTDVVIKADNTNGVALFTSTSSLTDLAPSLVGRAGGDEANAATAATDGTEGANCFKRGLFIDVAQADIFTSGNEKIVTELWIDD